MLFIDPRRGERARLVIAHSFGEPTFEILVAFLAFVRTAHYWTETHPTLQYEPDMIELMRNHAELARLMLDSSDADWANSGQALRRALDDLRNTTGALRFSEERFRALVMATSDILYRMNEPGAVSVAAGLLGLGLLRRRRYRLTNLSVGQDKRF
jgi:hypothetical protein